MVTEIYLVIVKLAVMEKLEVLAVNLESAAKAVVGMLMVVMMIFTVVSYWDIRDRWTSQKTSFMINQDLGQYVTIGTRTTANNLIEILYVVETRMNWIS